MNTQAGMGRAIIVGIIAILVIIGLGYFAINSSDEVAINERGSSPAVVDTNDSEEMSADEVSEMDEEVDVMEEEEMDQDTETEEVAAASGSYTDYTAGDEMAEEGTRTVLFFHASWCPTCRSLDANISASVSEIPEGVAIIKVDYDSATELRQKYGVTTQHTLVEVDSNGDLVTKWTGSTTVADIVAELN